MGNNSVLHLWGCKQEKLCCFHMEENMKKKFYCICIEILLFFLMISPVFAQNSDSVFVKDLKLKIDKQKAELALQEYNSNNDSLTLAKEYLEIGDNYYNLTEYFVAHDYYEKCLAILEKKASLNSVLAGDLYKSFSRFYFETGKYADSLSMAKKALESYDSKNLTNSDKYKIPACYNLIARAKGALGNYDESFRNAEKAISINPENYETKITSYHVKGHYLCYMNLFSKGIPILEEALKMKNGLEDLQTAEIYASLANANRNAGELDKSIEYCRKELEIFENFYGVDNVKTADAYRNLGTAYIDLGDFDRAISYIEKAKEIYLKTGISSGTDLAACYTNLGVAYEKICDNKKAMENLKYALKLDIEQYGETHASVATTYNNIACVYDSMGDLKNAIECQKKTVEIDTKIFGEKSPKCLIDYYNLASFYEELKDYEDAEKNYLISLEISKKESGKVQPQTIYMQLGHFLLGSQPQKAYKYYRKGLNEYKKNSENYRFIYGDIREIMESAEYFKLSENLANLISKMFSAAFEKIKQEKPDDSAKTFIYYAVQYEIWQRHYAKAFEYSEYIKSQKNVKAKDIQKWCGKNCAILKYVVCGERFYCIAITKQAIFVVPLASNSDIPMYSSFDYDSAINSLLDAMAEKTAKSEETFERQRNELYAQLIRPVLSYIKGAENVLIVPDGILSSLPFGMLRKDSETPVFEKQYTIEISSSVYNVMISDKGNKGEEK